MATKLRDLELEEVSLVDDPANPGARVTLLKRNEGEGEPEPEDDDLEKGRVRCIKCGAFQKEMPGDGMCPQCGAKMARPFVGKAVWSAAEVNDLPDSCFAYIAPGGKKENGKTVPRSLRKLPYRDASGKVDLAHTRNALARLSQSDIPAAEQGKIRAKLQAALESTKKADNAAPPEEDDMEKDELTAQVEKLTQDLAELTKERDALKARVDAIDNSPEAVEKRKLDSLPEDIRKRIEASEAEIAKMKDEKLTAEYVAKAKAIKQSAEFGGVLKRLATAAATAEDFTKLEQVLKAQAEQIDKGKLFATLGSDGTDPDVSGDDAEGEVIAKVRAKMNQDKGLDYAGAQAEVFKENPGLYDRYREAKKA
jgi:cell division protein FtsB